MSELIKRNPKRTQERLAKLRSLIVKKEVKRRFPSDFDNDDYLGWTSISCANVRYYDDSPLIKGIGHLTQLVDWCDDNCNGVYIIDRGEKVYFKEDTDAAMFTLVWK
tara:strand:+ start:73 stop:393 length:321 start_codon:yes stop_codon:yes gene_type:complete